MQLQHGTDPRIGRLAVLDLDERAERHAAALGHSAALGFGQPLQLAHDVGKDIHGRNATEFDGPSQPHAMQLCRYRLRVDIRAILRQNVEQLLVARLGRVNMTQFGRQSGIKMGGAQRVLGGEASVGIELLQRVAAWFKVPAWTLLVPGADFASLPRDEEVRKLVVLLNRLDAEQIERLREFIATLQPPAPPQPAAPALPPPVMRRRPAPREHVLHEPRATYRKKRA